MHFKEQFGGIFIQGAVNLIYSSCFTLSFNRIEGMVTKWGLLGTSHEIWSTT